jgi:NAD(P)H-dependent FMN reductase
MIGIISGTNRPKSKTRMIAEQYLELVLAKGVEVEILDLQELPDDFTVSALYSNSGKNQEFNALRDKMSSYEKFIVLFPEYNGSFPGVLKAFIDGLKYPSTFYGKFIALSGVSDGIQGGILGISHLTDIFNYLNGVVLPIKPKLLHVGKNMEEGKIVNPVYLDLIDKQVEMLISVGMLKAEQPVRL